jgi:hypothetical protein
MNKMEEYSLLLNDKEKQRLSKPPHFVLNPPPHPFDYLDVNELNHLDLINKNNNPEKFLVHLLNKDNKIGQCIDLRLQMTNLGLKKYFNTNTTTSTTINSNKNIKSTASFTGFSTHKQSIFNNNNGSSLVIATTTTTTATTNNDLHSTNNMLYFILLSFISLFFLLIILILFYFFIQR